MKFQNLLNVNVKFVDMHGRQLNQNHRKSVRNASHTTGMKKRRGNMKQRQCIDCSHCTKLKGIRGICTNYNIGMNIKNIEKFHECEEFKEIYECD